MQLYEYRMPLQAALYYAILESMDAGVNRQTIYHFGMTSSQRAELETMSYFSHPLPQYLQSTLTLMRLETVGGTPLDAMQR